MLRRQRRSPWPSPATLLYRPSLPVGLQGYILYRYRAVVWNIENIVIIVIKHLEMKQISALNDP